MGDNQIPCTHTGSLPRPDDLLRLMWARKASTQITAVLEDKVTLVPYMPTGTVATL